MLQSAIVNRRDFVDIKVEFGGLGRDAFGDLGQFGMAASNDGSGAATLRRTIVVAQASNVIAI